ncbi:hypothetical protein J19TS2_11250 [Cohnella xylanilytica]|nr:hypothetical protein J19TS2_11250 [Cohnella xylanilytica]
MLALAEADGWLFDGFVVFEEEEQALNASRTPAIATETIGTAEVVRFIDASPSRTCDENASKIKEEIRPDFFNS